MNDICEKKKFRKELRQRLIRGVGRKSADNITEYLKIKNFGGFSNLHHPIEVAIRLLLKGFKVHIYRGCCCTIVLKDLNYCNCGKPRLYELYVHTCDIVGIVKNCNMLYKQLYEPYKNNYLDVVLSAY